MGSQNAIPKGEIGTWQTNLDGRKYKLPGEAITEGDNLHVYF